MRIHYQKSLDEPEKIIADVAYIGIVDAFTPATVLLENGRELTIRLNRIEAIFDESMFDAAVIAKNGRQQ